jgi:hypothetical protein
MITFLVYFFFLSRFACIYRFMLEQKYVNVRILTPSLPVQLSLEDMVQPQLINLQLNQLSQCQRHDIASHERQRRRARVCGTG